GCPQSCNNRGNCRRQQPSDSSSLAASDWHCVCLGINQWRGDACQHSIEKDCSDGVDNDGGNGLVDCFDPDCCHQTDCATAATCKGGAIAKQVLLSESPLPAVSSFEKRVKFLVGKESVQLGYSPGSIDPKQISVLMGRLFLPDGSQLIGSRQEARSKSIGRTQLVPARWEFHTLRPRGSGLIALSFRRSYAPNRSLQAEVLLSGVPVGAFLNLGNIVLTPADAGHHNDDFLCAIVNWFRVYSEKRTVNSGCSPMLRLPLPTVQQSGATAPPELPDSKELLPVKLLSDSLPTGLAEVLCQLQQPQNLPVSVGFRFSSCSRIDLADSSDAACPGRADPVSTLASGASTKCTPTTTKLRPWIMERLPVGSGAASLSTSRAAQFGPRRHRNWSRDLRRPCRSSRLDSVAKQSRFASDVAPFRTGNSSGFGRSLPGQRPVQPIGPGSSLPEQSWSERNSAPAAEPGASDQVDSADGIIAKSSDELTPNGVLYYVDTYSIMRVSTGHQCPRDNRRWQRRRSGWTRTLAHAGAGPRRRQICQNRCRFRWPVDLRRKSSGQQSALHRRSERVPSVLRVGPSRARRGRPPHCPAANSNTDAAVNQRLRSPRSIEFTAQGELLLPQADGLWVMRSDGRLQAFPVAELPSLASSRLSLRHLCRPSGSVYRVSSRDASEIFTFSHEGKHLGTEDAVTGTVKYRFEHSTYDTSLGAPVLKIRMGNNATFELRNEYHTMRAFDRQAQGGGGRYSFEYERPWRGVTSATFPSGGRWLFRYTDVWPDKPRLSIQQDELTSC
uniref:EGF-like domain-containing protein n=1 Tax=Macrostomum lignano TaxID=282301 RepID=A0A1I8FGI5_9PLAT